MRRSWSGDADDARAGTLTDRPEPLAAGRPVWWHCLALGANGRPVWFAVVWSDRHGDGERIQLPVDDATAEVGEDAVATAVFDDSERVHEVRVGRRGAPKAPPLWFAEIRESTARPPAVNLVAFSGHGVREGRLVDSTALAELAVDSGDQLAAVRWYPATGEVDQVYVQPAHRRHSLSGAVIGAAATLSYARNWPRLWGDGQRTALGEQLRNASPWRHRAAELTHVAPPMTPETG